MPTDVYKYIIVMKSINEFFRQKHFDFKFLSFTTVKSSTSKWGQRNYSGSTMELVAAC